MNLPRLAIATGALAAAGTLALAPAALGLAPGPIATVLVANQNTNTSYDLEGVLTNGDFTLETAFGDANLTCSSGSAGGLVRGGTTGIDPAAAFTFDELGFACDSFIPGTSATMDIVPGCDIDVVMNDDLVHDGDGITVRTDTGGTSSSTPNYVSGTAYMSNGGVPCLVYTISNGCTIRIKGYVTAQFHEAASSGGGYQDLKLVGGGLEVAGTPYAPTGCLGMVNPGDDLKNLDFTLKVRVVAGTWKPIDFVPA
ncbi:hypothetical protein KM427_10845 [Nocardioides sp. LMS-CY]|uniref:hypothetical protein n=1 Tax=Nocardioides sp. (strain LMS-CY) TaxID=2840457 RepID=UPI001C006EA5|nr:hypothetical protein [Nocardioides sp. LMS-CY]QWF24137.1 hypothetical protein KM427_10845 [Nocardioides sp. LMS-CY]